MTKKNDDEFWKLTDSHTICSPKELLDLLKKLSHLKNYLYKPDNFHIVSSRKPIVIQDITFERVSFSRTHISGFIFRDCKFKRCLFIGSAITNCEFHNCSFRYTNTHKIRISNTYIDPKSFDNCLCKKHHQNIGVHLYQMLLRNSLDAGQIEFTRNAHFLFLRWKRFFDGYEIQNWEKRKKEKPPSWKYIKKCFEYSIRLFWEKIFGSGLRIRYFIRTVLLGFIFCVCLNNYFYEQFGLNLPDDRTSAFLSAIYFTVISFTTLGYGDIVPTTSIGQIWASLQSLFGFFLFAILTSMFFRRISP